MRHERDTTPSKRPLLPYHSERSEESSLSRHTLVRNSTGSHRLRCRDDRFTNSANREVALTNRPDAEQLANSRSREIPHSVRNDRQDFNDREGYVDHENAFMPAVRGNIVGSRVRLRRSAYLARDDTHATASTSHRTDCRNRRKGSSEQRVQRSHGWVER